MVYFLFNEVLKHAVILGKSHTHTHTHLFKEILQVIPIKQCTSLDIIAPGCQPD